MNSVLGEGGSALRTKTIRNSYHETGLGSGTVVDNINTFTGSAFYSIPLGSISAAGKVGFSISAGYSGNVREMTRADNEISPSSIIGTGWDMGIDLSVSVNHKGSLTIQDDVFYVSLGQDGGGQLVQNAAGRFFIATNPYVRISFDTATADSLKGQIESWTFEVPSSGIKYVFGEADNQVSNSERIVYHTNGNVRISSFSKASAKPYIYKWDLRKIMDAEGRNMLLFEYEKSQDTLFGSRLFTRESHLKSVKWLDRQDGEAMKWAFTYAGKTSDEYVAGDPQIPKYDMEPYETKYLAAVEQYASGVKSRRMDFYYSLKGSGKYVKRYLDSIAFSDRLARNSSAFIRSRPYKMEYGADTLFNVLTKVTDPSGASTEFSYTDAPLGAATAQPEPLIMKDTTHAEIVFPEDTAYANQTTCSERFCYIVADSNGVHGKFWMEIVHNPGNYFDTLGTFRLQLQGTNADTTAWRFIPFGDYLYVYNARDTLLWTYRWNGFTWNKGPVRAFNSFLNTSEGIEVYPSLDYVIVVEKTGSKSKTWPMLIEGDSLRDVNSPSCVVDNNGSYGGTVKQIGDGCMVWDGGVGVSTSGHFFLVTHLNTNLICAWSLNESARGFTDITSGFLPYAPAAQDTTNKNKWLQGIREISMGDDYFIVRSAASGPPAKERMDIFHFDGFAFHGVDSTGWQTADPGDFRAYHGGDYFLTANQNASSKEIWYWKKRISGDSLYFSKTLVRNDLPDTLATKPLIKTSPVGFSIEFPRPSAGIGNGAHFPRRGDSSNYQSYLYQVDADTTPGFRDRSSELNLILDSIEARMTNVSFSASDNLITALNFRAEDASMCADTASLCYVDHYTFKLRRMASGTQSFLYDRVQFHSFDTNITSNAKYYVVTSAARLGAVSTILSNPGNRLIYRLLSYDGRDYDDRPDSVWVVSSVVHHSGLASHKLDSRTDFLFHAVNNVYNIFSQTPMYGRSFAKQTDSDGVSLRETEYTHEMDVQNLPLLGRDLRLNGSLKEARSFDKAHQVTKFVGYFNRAANRLQLDTANWPGIVSISQADSSVTEDIGANLSRMTQKVSYHSYDVKNGRPRFTKTKMADTSYLVSQAVFNDTGLAIGSFAYDFATEPSDGTLNAWGDSILDTVNAISASKSEYSALAPYLPAKDSLWRDIDERFDDDSLKKGAEPIFNLKQGWLLSSKVTRRDSLNLVEETRAIKDSTDTVGTGTVHSSMFYEGPFSLPSGTVANARLSNCAILLGENGGLTGMSQLDFDGRWENPGASFSDTQVHTGNYSIKVVDDYGPRIDLTLDSLRKEEFGFVFSAWIYAESNVTPYLILQRRNSANAVIDSVLGQPVEGTIKRRRWQRWEARMTYGQLIAGGLFNGNRDYLRLWVGTGDPVSDPTRVMYVDDIVARPDNSTFNLMTYDYRGLPSSSTDTHHLTRYFENDFLGRTLISREERFRNYGQSAEHRLGENQ